MIPPVPEGLAYDTTLELKTALEPLILPDTFIISLNDAAPVQVNVVLILAFDDVNCNIFADAGGDE